MELFKCIHKSNSLESFFVFPHLGGSARQYTKSLMSLGNKKCSIYVLNLPGRDQSYKEPFIKTWEEALFKLLSELEIIKTESMTFWGHSMGALLAYDLAKVFEDKKTLLKKLYLSGVDFPESKTIDYDTTQMSDQELIKHISSWGGFPDEVLQNKSALEHFLPVVRADYELFQSYKYKSGKALKSPVVVMGVVQDKLTHFTELLKWQNAFESKVEFKFFPGEDHFSPINLLESWLK